MYNLERTVFTKPFRVDMPSQWSTALVPICSDYRYSPIRPRLVEVLLLRTKQNQQNTWFKLFAQ